MMCSGSFCKKDDFECPPRSSRENGITERPQAFRYPEI